MSVAVAADQQVPDPEPIVQIRNVSQFFRGKSHGLFSRRHDVIKAVDDISVSISKGECLAIVGESGCGKSTLARLVVGLLRPTSGDVLVHGQSTASISSPEMRKLRKRVQLVLQDPLASLDPRMTVKAILNEALVVHRLGASAEDRVTNRPAASTGVADFGLIRTTCARCHASASHASSPRCSPPRSYTAPASGSG